MAENFEKFWSAYPEDKRTDKNKAKWKWKELMEKGVDPTLLIRQAHGYSRLVKKEAREPRYIKTAVNWMNDRGWEDEYPPAIKRNSNWGPESTAGGW